MDTVITKRGRVKFNGHIYSHKRLVNYHNRTVEVVIIGPFIAPNIDDCCSVFNMKGRYICSARKVK